MRSRDEVAFFLDKRKPAIGEKQKFKTWIPESGKRGTKIYILVNLKRVCGCSDKAVFLTVDSATGRRIATHVIRRLGGRERL